MTRAQLRATAACFAFVAPSSVLAAQDVTGTIELRVAAANAPTDARVVVVGTRLQRPRETRTDASGRAWIPGLPVGQYTVELRQLGYRPVRIESVNVSLGRTTTLSATLERQSVELGEVLVTADRLSLDHSTASHGMNLGAGRIAALPLERNFRAMTTLIPMVNQSDFGDGEANVAGSTGYENAYYVDGMHVTQPKFGKTSANLPYNFVREVQVKTGGFEPEYGRALGGIVNVVTPIGGNDLRGEAFAFFTNDRFRGERLVGVLESNTRGFMTYDVGASLEGPIARDRIWFFAAYNPTVTLEDIEAPGLGFHRDSRLQHLFATKLTWQATPRTNVTLSALGDPMTWRKVGASENGPGAPRTLSNIDPVFGDVRSGGVNMAMRVRHVRRRTLLEGALFHDYRRHDDEAATARGALEPLVVDAASGDWSGGYGIGGRGHTGRTGAKISTSMFFPSHTVKVGSEYEDNWIVAANHGGFGRYGGLLFRNPAFYDWVRLEVAGTVRNRVVTGYVQDIWSATRNLRIVGGVRWDGQFLIDRTGALAQRLTRQWQPRLGLTYMMGRDQHKLFASGGRLYEQLPLQFALIEYAGLRLAATRYPNDPRVDSSGGVVLLNIAPAIVPEVAGLRGEYFDEFVLGYEVLAMPGMKAGIRVVRRMLGEIVEDAIDTQGRRRLGNPGRGELAHLPRPERDYTALVITLEKAESRLNYAASYTLSRNRGNYPGLYPTDHGLPGAINFGPPYDDTAQVSSGLLPNDRPHVFKFFGSYAFPFGLAAGATLLWQTGTPLSEYGGHPGGPGFRTFLQPRGTSGRTPTIADINLRLTQDLPAGTLGRPKVTLDVFHLASQRRAVSIEQLRYLAVDQQGNQIFPNPNFGSVLRYQPPMTARLGVSIDWGAQR